MADSGLTVSKMIRRVRSEIDEPLVFGIHDTEIVMHLNYIYEDLTKRCPSHLLDSLTTQKKFTITANKWYTGQKSVDFPDLIKVRAAMIYSNSSSEYVAAHFEANMERRWSTGFEQMGFNPDRPTVWLDFPTDVSPTYLSFFIGPKPASTITNGLLIYYIKDPTDLTVDDKTIVPGLPYQMHKMMIWGACYEILNSPKLNRGEYAQGFLMKYESAVKDFLDANPEPGPDTAIEYENPIAGMF